MTLTASLQPEYTITFTAANFLSAVLKVFIVRYCVQVLIQGHPFMEVLHDLLDGAPELCMHTDVVLFHINLVIPKTVSPEVAVGPSMVGYRYSWYHSHRRPWGTALPMSCPRCGAIRPWSRSKGDPDGNHPKARVSGCQAIGCGSVVRSKPLHDVYEIVHGDKTSGWVRYTISAAEVLRFKPLV